MGHLIYIWKAKQALVEYVDLPTPIDSVQPKSNLITYHRSKVERASV